MNHDFCSRKIGDRPFPPEPSPLNLTWQLLLIGFGLVNGIALVFIPLGMYGSENFTNIWHLILFLPLHF